MRCTVSDNLLSGGNISSWLSWISKKDPENFFMEQSEEVLSASSHNSIVSKVTLHNLILVAVNVEETNPNVGGSSAPRVSSCWASGLNA